MSDPFIWRITDGVVAFKAVDTAAVGYLPTWNAPAGKTVATVTMTDYETDSTFWRCQVTSGVLTPTADTTTEPVAATFCRLGMTVPNPKQSTWTLDVELFQDPHAGPTAPTKPLAQYCYEQDAKEVYFMLGLNGTTKAPRAIGRVRMSPTAFGGAAQTALTATASWAVTQWPSIAWGQTTPVFEDEGLTATEAEDQELANA